MSHHKRSNIILIGFMASGKSRVGEMLAKRLGYELIDTDAIIEREQQQTIKDIFASKGEWYFRHLESLAVRSLRTKEHAVIVAGGGVPMCFDNAQILKDIGQIFYLDANLALIESRLKKSNARPLGAASSALEMDKVKSLYVYRRPIYLGLGMQIDVSHENKAKTCDEISERFKAVNRVNKYSHTMVHDVVEHYRIIHQPHALDAIDDVRIASGLKDHRPVIVTTDRLAEVLAPAIATIKEKLNTDVPVITFGDGEHHKNHDSITKLHEQMFALGLTRRSLLLALGGGNVGDVTGFAAATFLRGIPYLQIPTTLLAMTDASIGGKTGIDLALGKNLVGAFYNPAAVIIDSSLLTTLPKDDFACGMAEIIKHAIIADRELFYALKNEQLSLPTVIERSLRVKANIVLADPKEKSIRAHLNLGHTFGHAIEKQSGYTIKHGAAVAIGLMEACTLARKLGVLEEDFQSDLEALLKKFELPTTIPEHLDKRALLAAMCVDKKRDEHGLQFIVPKRLGEVIIERVLEDDVW